MFNEDQQAARFVKELSNRKLETQNEFDAFLRWMQPIE
jgi:hypothetical protein